MNNDNNKMDISNFAEYIEFMKILGDFFSSIFVLSVLI